MAFQKGPGEGYHAAKDAALALDDRVRCRAVYYGDKIAGYVVENAQGRTIGSGRMSRDAWGTALDSLKRRARRKTFRI